jgi:hypothetical protein
MQQISSKTSQICTYWRLLVPWIFNFFVHSKIIIKAVFTLVDFLLCFVIFDVKKFSIPWKTANLVKKYIKKIQWCEHRLKEVNCECFKDNPETKVVHTRGNFCRKKYFDVKIGKFFYHFFLWRDRNMRTVKTMTNYPIFYSSFWLF